jgi:hypothetical protein
MTKKKKNTARQRRTTRKRSIKKSSRSKAKAKVVSTSKNKSRTKRVTKQSKRPSKFRRTKYHGKPLVEKQSEMATEPWVCVGRSVKRFSKKTLLREFGDLPVQEWERNIKDRWVKSIAFEMVSGLFVWELVQLVTCDVRDPKSGKTVRYLLNGQHSLSAIEAYLPNDWKHDIGVLRYRAKDEDVMRLLYTRIDRSWARSSGHVFVARLFNTKAFDSVSVSDVKLLGSGVRKLTSDRNDYRDRKSVDEVSDMMLEKLHKPTLASLRMITGKKDARGKFINPISAIRHVRRAAVVAAMIATHKKARSKKEWANFWTAVRDGANLRVKSPQVQLMLYLKSGAINNGCGSVGRNKNSVDSKSMYYACLKAWNCFRNKENMDGISIKRGEDVIAVP